MILLITLKNYNIIFVNFVILIWPFQFENIGTLLALDILEGRWLVAVYQEAVVALWDLHPSVDVENLGLGFKWHNHQAGEHAARCRTICELQGIGLCTSSTLSMTRDKDAIFLAVSRYVFCRLRVPVRHRVMLPTVRISRRLYGR